MLTRLAQRPAKIGIQIALRGAGVGDEALSMSFVLWVYSGGQHIGDL